MIAVTYERRIEGIKVRKQVPIKMKFSGNLVSDILTYHTPLRNYRNRVRSVIHVQCVNTFPTA